jgi:parallel beta-helix repeat protein
MMKKSGKHQHLPMLPLYVLFFLIQAITVQAATYYVATTGNDANSCAAAQNVNTPKKTIQSGLGCPGPGDTVYIRGGTYAERIDSGNYTIPTGTSWNAPVTIAGYPGETVMLNPSGGQCVLGLGHTYIQYIIFDNLHLNGVNLQRDSNSTNVVGIGWGQVPNVPHIKIQNTEIYNSPWNGLIINRSTDIHLINLSVHDNGWWTQQIGYEPGANGVYSEMDNGTIVGGSFYNNNAVGIRVWANSTAGGGAHDNVIRNVRAFNNGYSGILVGQLNNQVYNNLAYSNGHGGIHINDGSNAQVYNNTAYNNPYGVLIATGSSHKIINNILHSNGTNITNGGSGTTFTTNLCTSSGTGCAIVGNPALSNAGGNDFRLQPGSIAIDSGTTIPSVTTDHVGTSRPRSTAYDIGAYEATGTLGGPAPPRNLTVR